MTTKYILGQMGENGKPRTIEVEQGVTPERSVEERDLIKLIIDAVWKATDGGVKMTEHQFYHFEELNGAINTFLEALQTERQKREEMVEEALVEYRQFILNVLDGIDIADGQCNTKAIRFALQSRTIHSELDQLQAKINQDNK